MKASHEKTVETKHNEETRDVKTMLTKLKLESNASLVITLMLDFPQADGIRE